VMSRDDVERVRARSRSKDSPAWRDNWNEMGKKTVFKRLSKWLPLSAAAQEAIAAADSADPVDVESETVQDDATPPPPATVSGLPRREVRPARVSTVVDAAPPPPPPETGTPPPPPPAAAPAAAKRGPGRPPRAATPPPAPPVEAAPPPPPEEPAGPRAELARWIEENGITLEELNQASADYQGWDAVPSFERLSDEQVEFFNSNAPTIADAIRGMRV